MSQENMPIRNSSDDEARHGLTNMSLVEMGEKLFQWRYFSTIPALMLLLLCANATARTATVGTLLILIGAGVRVYTVAFMADDTHDAVGSEYLVTTGPFAIIRNPLYIANLLITLGVVFYAGVVILGVPFLMFFAFQYHCITKYEEHALLGKFGEEYQRYMDRVPAWIPLRVPVADDFPVPASISGAFIAEKRAIAAIASILFLLMLAAH